MLNLLQLTVDKLVCCPVVLPKQKREVADLQVPDAYCGWDFFGESRCFLTNQTATENESKRDYAKDPCIQSPLIPQAIASRNPRDCEDHMPGPPAKKKNQALRPVRPCNRNQKSQRRFRNLILCYGYVMDMLWIQQSICFLDKFALCILKDLKKNNCQARGVVSCIVQDLVQFHLDIPQSHRLQASREPIAMCANRPWFCAVLRIK